MYISKLVICISLKKKISGTKMVPLGHCLSSVKWYLLGHCFGATFLLENSALLKSVVYHFTDNQLGPQGHHFGATYFFFNVLKSVKIDRKDMSRFALNSLGMNRTENVCDYNSIIYCTDG